MSGIPTLHNAPPRPIQPNQFEHWRHRLMHASRPSKPENQVKKNTDPSDVMSRRKRALFVAALLFRYRMKKLLSRCVDRILPTGERDMAIRWVPLNTSASRRLETLAAFAFSICASILPLYSYFLFYYLLYSRLWWLALIYLFYVLNDHDVASRGGRRWEAYRNWVIHRYIARYFPVKLVKTADLDPTRNYIVPACPHGQMMIGATTCFLSNATDFSTTFPGIKSHLAMLSGHFRAPFLRDINLFSGGVSTSEESMMYLMNKKYKGNLVCINLGGSAEAMESRHEVYKIIAKNRKGFARIAIKTGASVVPVFCFGETRAFNTEPYPQGTWIRKLQDKVGRLTGIPPIAVRGRGFLQYNFGIIPFRTPITVVVGEPIEVKQTEDPTSEDIDALHSKYIEKLVELFETHKHKYEADPTIRLVVM